MLVLGLDHSTTNTGWGLVKYSGSKDNMTTEYVEHGFVGRPKGLQYPLTILYMGEQLQDLLATKQPDYVALEAPKDNRGFKATQVLTELVGIFKYILMKAGYGFVEIPPSTMKKIVTTRGWSTKEEVAIAVARILQKPFEDLVPAIYYKTGQKAGEVKEYILDGSDALGLAIAFVPYLKSHQGQLNFRP